MDGPYAAVKFPPKDSALQAAAAAAVSNEEAGILLQDVRLLRKDELQVIISLLLILSLITKFCLKEESCHEVFFLSRLLFFFVHANLPAKLRHNPPNIFFSLVAIWPLTAQVWLPVKNFSR